jgi:Fe-S cluster assembly protein SufD
MTQRARKPNEWYSERFDIFEKSLNGETGSPLHAHRRDAMAWFQERGFPTIREEEWRFTNVSPIAAVPFVPAPRGEAPAVKDIRRFLFEEVKTSRLVFVNGIFSPELSRLRSLPEGVKAGSLAGALESDTDTVLQHLLQQVPFDRNGFTALNTAFARDGGFVSVPDGTVVEEPIHLLFLATGDGEPFFAGPRNLIVVGRNSSLPIVESFVSLANNSYFTNVVSEFVLGENALVEHDKLQMESAEAYHVSTTHVHQRGTSNFTSNSIAFGGRLVRNDLSAHLDGEGVECTMNGLSVAAGDQLVDNHTTIDHAMPNCSSHELYKSILDGNSRGVFNGKIIVRKDAQKTDAKQTNRTLLLSDEATIDTKPQLEIFADDVKCTHGATVGQLDEEQLFYLRTRGLGEVAAKDILTYAFASDVIQKVHIDPLREQLDRMLHDRLQLGRVVHQTQG